MSNRELLLDAAEAIVREQGIEAVTLRAVAARAHFGKSTVHEAFGSTAGLTNALTKRAATELLYLFNQPPPPAQPDTQDGEELARRAAQWIMDNPEWARLAVQPGERDTELPLGEHPIGAEFFAPQHQWLDTVDPVSGQAMVRSARIMMLAAVELVTTINELERGARVLVSVYEAVLNTLEVFLGGEDAFNQLVTVSANSGDT